MYPAPAQLYIEKCIATAHRSISAAERQASLMGEFGLEQDLREMAKELSALGERLISGNRLRHAPLRGQLDLTANQDLPA